MHELLEKLPRLAPSAKRRIYVSCVTELELEYVRERGYDPVDVFTLPRSTVQEQQSCIMAWLQGMSEGTIEMDAERRKALELEARACGMLVNRALRLEGKVSMSPETVDELLESFDQGGQHTLKNSILAGRVVPQLEERKEGDNA